MLNKFLIQPENGKGEIVNILNVSSIERDENVSVYVSNDKGFDSVWYIVFDFNGGVSVPWEYCSKQDRNTDLNLIMTKFGAILNE